MSVFTVSGKPLENRTAKELYSIAIETKIKRCPDRKINCGLFCYGVCLYSLITGKGYKCIHPVEIKEKDNEDQMKLFEE